MEKNILVVDDEKDIVDLLKYNLQKEGYTVSTAFNGKEALEKTQERPNLILLDVMMPELDGWEVVKEIRRNESTSRLPVIFLTAKCNDVDEILGLELGADDYIRKPISIPKLIARIKSVLRKHEALTPQKDPRISIKLGVVEIIPAQHRVRINDKDVFFSKKELEIFYYLASRADVVVNREELLNSIWGTAVYVVDRSVDVYIRKIREKLGKYANYIETIRGVGYRVRSIPVA
ncbi:MAG: response regulator transcription factor [Bacteroidota bacterium]|jgi:two-component system alkaline phosphatase synthesis response regulator PhoP